jgi:hypothetical protein
VTAVLAVLLLAGQAASAQDAAPPPVPLVDVPFVSQTEALCGGAAAAMVLRYWGERGVSAESFAHLVDRSAAGIRTDALTAEIVRQGWRATPALGSEALARAELANGRPVLALIEDRPGTFHYVVVVAWHERGVVFHDPARAPFRVMSVEAFTRRWRAANAWMLVVVPGAGRDLAAAAGSHSVGASPTSGSCDDMVTAGVAAAQANDVTRAEQTLAAAVACGGSGALRELAGVRLLQRRWPDVGELASAAIGADPGDAYAWKLLATSRFIQEDLDGALAAWNRVGEPRLDLVRVDGLMRTRHRVVERLIGLEAGDLVTSAALLRARRRLAELPSAISSRLDYAPVPGGLAELRGAVNERVRLPSGALAVAGIGLSALATREVGLSIASPSGGGERIAAAWRFWPHRPRIAAGIRAPAPWGGIWGVNADAERQPFDAPALAPAERVTATVTAADWAAATVRWEIQGGVEQRKGAGNAGLLGGSAAWVSPGNRAAARAAATTWLGENRFGSGRVSLNARSRANNTGIVVLGSSTLEAVSRAAPLDIWAAGDTGHARPTLLRAHPVLDDGRLRVPRLGRLLATASAEAQRWWPRRGAIRAAGALFVDAGWTGRRLDGPARYDVDPGIGLRLTAAGIPGVFRIDLAKGLRDGATALSLTYNPGTSVLE